MQTPNWIEIQTNARKFATAHADDWSEAGHKQTFWNEFFQVFGLRRASFASFEENVKNLKGNVGKIDLLWKGKLLVEQKSLNEDLSLATTQAHDYIAALMNSDRAHDVPRFVLVSDFARLVLYDLEPDDQLDLPLFAGRHVETFSFPLADLPQHVRLFDFMLGRKGRRTRPEDPANEKAYALMCELHDALRAGNFAGHDLERLLVRVLFCLFAEDTQLFAPDVFTQFIRERTNPDGSDVGARLNELFDWLNRREAEEVTDDSDSFYGFRYVNGGLFADRLGFPRFNRAMRDTLLKCCGFQWAAISPAVFGSLFQGVLEDRVRRQQGAHYTSERDIMKVLRSLFLDDLRAEWARRVADRSSRRRAEMEAFHARLRTLRFLDPACGCGNFLVLAYRELRALETEVVSQIHGKEQQVLDVRQLLRVDVDQFYGIEYSEWPVRIAEVALWLMDHQMNRQAADQFGQGYDRLPLKTSPHIVQGNALRLDWNDLLPREQCSYILGNPPFVGKKARNIEQQSDMAIIWGDLKGAGTLDYVTCWYRKAADYIDGTNIPIAFVSTNSIAQGEQVGILWNFLFQRYALQIQFAHRTFSWISEARGKAHVHVVIIGFGTVERIPKLIYDYQFNADSGTVSEAENINPYLSAGNNIMLRNRSQPINDVPEVQFGSMPNDKGHFLFTGAEKAAFLAIEPQASPLFREFISAHEYLHGQERWCLWLADAEPALVRRCSGVMARIEAVRTYRLASMREATRKLASVPGLFGEIRVPHSRFILIPRHSSENRAYIPFSYFERISIPADSCLFIEDTTPFHFGVLSSSVSMAWTKAVCGRLESRYRYSAGLVYNNFPWPTPTPTQKTRVEEKARAVLAARGPFLPPRGMSTLADLYHPLTMPPALAKAHAELDRAVEHCYRREPFGSDRERVELLFRLYEQLTAPLLPATPVVATRRRRSKAATPSASRRGRTPGLPEQP